MKTIISGESGYTEQVLLKQNQDKYKKDDPLYCSPRDFKLRKGIVG